MSHEKGYKADYSDDFTSETNGFAVAGGLAVLFILILLCILGAVINERRKRSRIAQESFERAENAEREISEKKIVVERELLSIRLHSDVDEEAHLTTSCSGESEGATSLPLMYSQRLNQTEIIGTDCPICYQEFEEGDIIGISHNTNCSHFFHKECLISWLARNERCPTCRRIYMREESE